MVCSAHLTNAGLTQHLVLGLGLRDRDVLHRARGGVAVSGGARDRVGAERREARCGHLCGLLCGRRHRRQRSRGECCCAIRCRAAEHGGRQLRRVGLHAITQACQSQGAGWALPGL